MGIGKYKRNRPDKDGHFRAAFDKNKKIIYATGILKTREQFEKAMQEEEKRSAKPCASCFHRPDCTDEWNCGILRQWRIKYMEATQG